MKFGVMYELSVPRPFTSGIEQTVIENALEQIRLADWKMTTTSSST